MAAVQGVCFNVVTAHRPAHTLLSAVDVMCCVLAGQTVRLQVGSTSGHSQHLALAHCAGNRVLAAHQQLA